MLLVASRVLTVDTRIGRQVRTKLSSAGAPGLYFVGRFFQYALTSSLIYGVGRDAEHIAAQIASRDAVRLAPP